LDPALRIQIKASAALSCFGEGPLAHRPALREGRSGLKPAAPGAAWTLPGALIPDSGPLETRPIDLAARVVDAAVAQAGLTARQRERCAVFFGTTTGLAAAEEATWLSERQAGSVFHGIMRHGGPGRLACMMAARIGSHAPAFSFTTACTSTAVGMVMAARMLRSRRIERALVLGLDVMMRVAADGFRYLQLYSETRCRPFDRDRDGLQLGEGCAALLLEPGDGGRFELLDGAIAHDSSHIAAGSSDGRTAATVIEEALRRSAIAPAEVTAIKAHGTGTPTNDLSELNALDRIFGGRPPPFTSLKGAFGHTLGASAALETAAWLWCLEEGFIPPTHGFATPSEPALSPLTSALETGGRPGVHLFNAFGFGGTSVAYLVRDRGQA
jgi:3-oxoacyl-(acyl-carrier-protein) synthase